jgi:GT2 family glycosyltransferase
MTVSHSPAVSVIVVNWNGREHLTACFRSLEASQYPRDRLELILVDNGSTDGSLELMRSAFPGVRLVALSSNLGFTGGNSAGVAASSGRILVFFNNDMRIDPGAIPALVAALDEGHPCAAARVLSWNGKRIDFLRGTTSFEARGFQEHYGEPRAAWLDYDTTSFSPNGGAFAVTRAAYERSGGFDEQLFAYYDDVDLGWRLRLTGADVRVVADALVYHRHGATSSRYPSAQKRFLMERNALWIALKNYGGEALTRVLGPTLLLAAERLVLETRIARSSALARALAPFSARCRPPWASSRGWRAADIYETAEGAEPVPPKPRTLPRLIRRMPVESLAALGSTLDALPAVIAARRAVQQARSVGDEEVLPTMGRGLEALSSVRPYLEAQQVLVRALDLEPLFTRRPRVLLVTAQAAGTDAASGLLALGRALSSTVSVAVALPSPSTVRETGYAVVPYDPGRPAVFRRLATHFDAVVAEPEIFARFPFLADVDLPLAANLLVGSPRPRLGEAALRQADFFLCADEPQRAAWVSVLAAAGRITPDTAATTDAEAMVAVVSLDPADRGTATGRGHGAGAGLERLRRFCEAPRFAPDRAVRVQEYKRRLEQSYCVSKWTRRRLLALGVSEHALERFKQSAPVRAAMSARDLIVITLARRR